VDEVHEMQIAIHIAGTILAGLAGVACAGALNALLDAWTAREGPATRPGVCRQCGASLKGMARPAWLALHRRCPACGTERTLRYRLVALAMAATWAVAAWQALPALYLPGWEGISIFDALVFGAVRMILCAMLICLAVMDAESRWLPDWFTMGGAALGLVFSIGRFAVYALWHSIPLHWSMEEGGFGSHRQRLYDSVARWFIGVVVLPGVLLLGRWIYQSLRKQDGVRAGEAKLMLLLAAWLGFSHSLVAFVLGILLAAVAALIVAARRGNAAAWIANMPFASFLCAGGILSGLWGGKLIEVYLRWCDFA
jgi:leader peptidase (prepilin peptidase)/N-methyltransferase